jgi:hypothetical protein
MLTSEPTTEMISEWKKIFEKHKGNLMPNRKSGIEVDKYFREKYNFISVKNEDYARIVTRNILENEHSFQKLGGLSPDIKVYFSDDIYVGIDLISGEFQIECEDVNSIIPIYDDLFVFRGLDNDDIQNYYLVAQYITLTSR